MRHVDVDNESLGRAGATGVAETLVPFLISRLVEELALLWERDRARADRTDRPGLAAQVAVLDELLLTLRAGLLPPRRELRMLLYGYGAHPDHHPDWPHLLHD